MTKTFKRIIITAIVLIALAGAASAAVLSGGCSSSVGGASANSPLEQARNSILNAVVDASGIKGQISSELREEAGSIAGKMGVSQSVADNVVDSLAIEDWSVTTLPSDAVEAGTYSVDAGGMSAKVTTYDDPSIVTIDAYGQSLTMEIPESAQDYMPYLQYLQYMS